MNIVVECSDLSFGAVLCAAHSSAAVADFTLAIQSMALDVDVCTAAVDLPLFCGAYVQRTCRAPMAFHGYCGQGAVAALVVLKCGANGWEILEDLVSGRVVLCSAHWTVYLEGAVHVATLVAR